LEYINGLAIFIDILGTKNSNFNDLYKIFHKELITLKTGKSYAKNL